jgi:hypothetical protein
MPSETFIMKGWYLGADMYGAFFMLIGTLMLIGFLKFFAGNRFKKHAILIGTGMLLFSVLHEGGEFICGSGIHGGFPETFLGSFHVIFLGSIGSIIFFIGCYIFQKRYFQYIKEK